MSIRRRPNDTRLTIKLRRNVANTYFYIQLSLFPIAVHLTVVVAASRQFDIAHIYIQGVSRTGFSIRNTAREIFQNRKFHTSRTTFTLKFYEICLFYTINLSARNRRISKRVFSLDKNYTNITRITKSISYFFFF